MKKLLIFLVLIIALQTSAHAMDFPEGTFELISFKVEKDNKIIFTEKDMYFFKSSVEILQIKKNMYQVKIDFRAKKTANSNEHKDKRIDTFQIIFLNENAGNMLNLDQNYKKDESKFQLFEDKLIITSWVHRHGIMETHVYSLKDMK